MEIKYGLYLVSNFFLDIYYNLKSKIFFINDIQETNLVNKRKLFFNFYLVYYLNFALRYFPDIFGLKNLINQKCNSKYELIKLNYSNGKLNRNIIYKNINLLSLIKIVDETFQKKIFDENEIMMMKKHLVLDIYFKDINNSKVSIKNLINDYADKTKYFEENKIKNICKLENINIHNNKIYIVYLKVIKKIEKEYDLENNDYHVSDIFDI